MGALLSKPSASSFRVWDLNQVKTVDYLDNFRLTNISVYLFGGKPVRILPVNSWISDRLRFSFDGWFRQRLSSCFIKGVKSSWYKSLSYFTHLILLKNIQLHWSSVESGLINPLLKFLFLTSTLSVPYTNVRGFSNSDNPTYRWSGVESYPTYFTEPNTFLYKSENSSRTVMPRIQPILTSLEETEVSPVKGTFSGSNSGLSCFVQTESLTAFNYIYFGTHGYVNANNSLISFPILMAYERTNSVTGDYFLKGPKDSRSLASIVFALMQIYSNFETSYLLDKPYFIESFSLISKTAAQEQQFLPFLRQPVQYQVSPLVQILDEFIKSE